MGQNIIVGKRFKIEPFYFMRRSRVLLVVSFGHDVINTTNSTCINFIVWYTNNVKRGKRNMDIQLKAPFTLLFPVLFRDIQNTSTYLIIGIGYIIIIIYQLIRNHFKQN